MTSQARKSLVVAFIVLLACVLAWFGRGTDEATSSDDDDSAVAHDDDDSGDDNSTE